MLEEKINDAINNSNTIISLCFIHKQIQPPRTFPWTAQEEVIFIVVIISLLLLHYPIITKRTNICVTLNPHHQDRSNLSKLLSFVNFFVAAPWLRLNISQHFTPELTRQISPGLRKNNINRAKLRSPTTQKVA